MKDKIQAHWLNASIKRTIVIASVVMLSAYSKAQSQTKEPDLSKGIFPKGQQGPAENFTGKAWNYGLVPADSSLTTIVGNVYFEPGARSNRVGGPMA